MRAGAEAFVVVGTIMIASCGDSGNNPDAAIDARARLALPAPTGTYAIGTDTRLLIDDSRPELQTSEPSDRRRLVVQLWYPADATAEGTPVTYVTTAEGVAIAAGEPRLAIAPTSP